MSSDALRFSNSKYERLYYLPGSPKPFIDVIRLGGHRRSMGRSVYSAMARLRALHESTPKATRNARFAARRYSVSDTFSDMCLQVDRLRLNALEPRVQTNMVACGRSVRMRPSGWRSEGPRGSA